MLHPNAFSYCSISISYKYVKQVVLINDSWISTTLQKEWELDFCFFFKKWRRIHFSPKKGEVGKTVEEWRLLRENNLCFLFSLTIYLSIIYIYICMYIYSYSEIASLYQEQTPLPYLACGAHFQFNNDDLFENFDLN